MDKSVETTRTEFNTCAPAAPRPRCSTGSRSTTTARRRRSSNWRRSTSPEPRMLTIQPFDPTQIKAIEKAIMESDLGLQPSNDGKLIRLPIPQLTEERRKELVKLVRQLRPRRAGSRSATSAATSMRHLEELVKNGEVGDDEERRAEDAGAEAHRRARRHDRRAAQAQRSRDHGGLSIRSAQSRILEPSAEPIPTPQRSRSSWTATAAGPSGAACRSRTATARARARSGRTVEAAIDLGVESLAVYAFSTENWSRPSDEVDALMEIFGETIERELPDLAEQGVRTRFIGRRDRAPDELQATHGGARGRDGERTTGSASGSRSTTAAAPSSSRRRGGSSRAASTPEEIDEDALAAQPLRARAARSRPADPHVGRAAASRTSCSGSSRTRSSSSSTRSGPTSARPTSASALARLREPPPPLRRRDERSSDLDAVARSTRRRPARSSSASSGSAAGGCSRSRCSPALVALHEFYAMARPLRPLVARRLRGRCSRPARRAARAASTWMLGGFLATLVLAFLLKGLARRAQPADGRVGDDGARAGLDRLGLGASAAPARPARARPARRVHGAARRLRGRHARVPRSAALVGRHKLAPALSPGKTWEGFVAGTVAGGASSRSSRSTTTGTIPVDRQAIVLGLAIALAGAAGDLFESALKRDMQVKDTGGCSAATAACSTASTRSSSPRWPPSTWSSHCRRAHCAGEADRPARRHRLDRPPGDRGHRRATRSSSCALCVRLSDLARLADRRASRR